MIKEGKNNRQVFLSIANMEENTHNGIRQGFFRLGRVMRLELRREVLKKNKTGIIYTNVRRKFGGLKRIHQSSAKKQTPANLSGNYRSSVRFKISGSQSMEFGIDSGAPYAKFLEDNLNRPGVGNAVFATQKEAQNLFESSIQAEII